MRIGERLLLALAKRLSRKLVYYCAIRVWHYATSGQFSKTNVSKIPMAQALQRFYSGEVARRKA